MVQFYGGRSGWRKAYEVLKNTNWKDDPDGVVKAHEELIKTHLDPRGITGHSKARHDNSLIRLMMHFDHTFGKGNHAVRTKRWRYIRYHDGGEELYDHDADPKEWTNLAKLSRYSSLIERLRKTIPK